MTNGTQVPYVGIDIDPDTVRELAGRSKHDLETYKCCDALETSFQNYGPETKVIMNPPWGAKLDHDAAHYRDRGYSLARGQFNSWDLFVEWTLNAFVDGVTVAAIVPDSIFLGQHSDTRKMLVEKSQLKAIVRIGEGWFPGVFRGATLLVYKVGGKTDNPVDLCKIDNETAKEIRRGFVDPMQIFRERSLGLRRDEFCIGADYQFAFPGVTKIRETMESINQKRGDWANWFRVGRGVEIGSNGKIQTCKSCGVSVPKMKSLRPCAKCGAVDWNFRSIVDVADSNNISNLILGRDVRRFSANPSRKLETSATGINYKDPSLYDSPKLLIRKTGLGLVAGIDFTGAYTNQVVFNYVPKGETESWVIYYVEAMLCSRMILAYHISRTGENQWRSHPYVTPSVISALPILVPRTESDIEKAQDIADIARSLHSSVDEDTAEIEEIINSRIEKLYDLSAEDKTNIESVLSEVQDLEAFAHIRRNRKIVE